MSLQVWNEKKLNVLDNIIEKWHEKSEINGTFLPCKVKETNVFETNVDSSSYPGLVLLFHKNSYGVPMSPPVNCCQVHKTVFTKKTKGEKDLIKDIICTEGRHFNN